MSSFVGAGAAYFWNLKLQFVLSKSEGFMEFLQLNKVSTQTNQYS